MSMKIKQALVGIVLALTVLSGSAFAQSGTYTDLRVDGATAMAVGSWFTNPAILPETVFHIGASDTTVMVERIISSTAAPNIRFAKARGTPATGRLGIQSADQLGAVVARGFVGTTGLYSPSVAAITFISTETYNATSNGAKMTFRVTPNGSTVMQEQLVIEAIPGAGITFGNAITPAAPGDLRYVCIDEYGRLISQTTNCH